MTRCENNAANTETVMGKLTKIEITADIHYSASIPSPTRSS